jgi:uncharacterized membrane protein
MRSRASIAGHPIHPMLVVFPIGLWVFSFVADLFYVGSGHNPIWSAVAYYTMIGGIIGALAAVVPGAIDLFSVTTGRVRMVGILHMTLNLVAAGLFVINAWLRTTQETLTAGPIWLSGISIALLSISGWLGAEMVYRHGVGVETIDD